MSFFFKLLFPTSLTLCGIYSWTQYLQKQTEPYEPYSLSFSNTFRFIPSRFLSRIWGRFAQTEFRPSIQTKLLALYSSIYGCNLEEAQSRNLENYSSLKQFFTRELKRNSREICSDQPIIAPCDGTALTMGRVSTSGLIRQVKGIDYKISEFIGEENFLQLQSKNDDCNLYYISFHLSPADHHYFHSPTTWIASRVVHFKGQLLPVAQWCLRKVPGVLNNNERVIVTGSWSYGIFAFAAVGAFNVGSIKFEVLPQLQTNLVKNLQDPTKFDISNTKLSHGQLLGRFEMGSTIVLIFQAPNNFKFIVNNSSKVKYGQPIGILDS